MIRELIHQLEVYGYRARVVSIRRLHDLAEAIENVYKQGLLDEELYQEHLARFVTWSPEDLPEARSLIVVSLKSPQVCFHFGWKGKYVSLIVPPTYVYWGDMDKQLDGILTDRLGPGGNWAKRAFVPIKLLAVCSGLAVYGKNNISYIDGMGSFHRLSAFYSNIHCEQDYWRKPKVMDRCDRCVNCVRSCPSGAIDPKRFVLRGERCITFWNEQPGQVAFPEKLEPSWHNCLVGCMHCQRVCPENRGVRNLYEEGGEFSEEETGFLLEGKPQAELSAELAEKLERFDLLWMYDILSRNLTALLCG